VGAEQIGLARAAKTAKNGSALRTSSPKYSNACGQRVAGGKTKLPQPERV